MMKLTEAKAIAERVVETLRPFSDRICIAGSIRREKPEVKDIEVIRIPTSRELINFCQTVDKWKKVKGNPYGKYTQRDLPEGIKLDLFMVTKETWALQLAIRTGSADFSYKVLASGWSAKGYVSEGGILTRGDGTVVVKLEEEEDLFDLIGIPYIEPHKREFR